MLHDLVHYIHVLAGVVWGGGIILVAWVVFPLIGQQSFGSAKEMFARVESLAGPVLATSGVLVYAAGIARGWMGGVTSFPDLMEPYGRTVLGAFFIVTVFMGIEGAMRSRLRKSLADEATFAASFQKAMRLNRLLITGGVVIIIAIMAALRLGLY